MTLIGAGNWAGQGMAQELPDMETLTMFAAYEERLAGDPGAALAMADSILARADDPDLRLRFAESALAVGNPTKALELLQPIVDGLERHGAAFDMTDPRATLALDLMSRAYAALGQRDAALTTALRAYNAAEARLGSTNPALLDRLKRLEPEIAELRPNLLAPVQAMRQTIEKGKEAKRNIGDTDPTAVKVWFGTNRLATGATDPAQMFGSDRGELTVGSLTVTIPPGHMAGMIERPSGWFFTEHPDPAKHVVLESLKGMAQEAFAEGCCGDRDRLLFIHGYNVTFHDGALRAAQLAFDLEFPGEAMYYSWPSKASLYGYLSDSNGVLASRPAMETFFEMATRGEGKLHVIAHSMGNRYAIEALETFFLRHPDRRLGQLILAAPDVDRAELKARFPGLSAHTDGITLYASKHDKALQVSNMVNGGRRAGDANGELVRIAGLDTVDASLIEADTLGHSYFGDAPQLLGDILGVVRLGWSAPERCGVQNREVVDGGGGVWDVRADGCRVSEVRTASDLMRIFGEEALGEAETRMSLDQDTMREFWLGVMDVIRERT